jgi:hypothetical protein
MINLVFSIMLTCAGSIGLFYATYDMVRAWRSRRWPTGEAIVISIAVHERRGIRGRRRFEPTIDFRYTFEGREYHGHRIAFGDVSSSDKKEIDDIADRFHTGTAWRVSVCKNRPELAILHPGIHGKMWVTLCFFLVYTTCSVMLMVDSIQRILA